jgi:hypothetical protein
MRARQMVRSLPPLKRLSSDDAENRREGNCPKLRGGSQTRFGHSEG